jgi:DNA-binding MarR family transcriptional regulator
MNVNHYETEASAEAGPSARASAAGQPDPSGPPILADRLYEVLPRTVKRMRHETRSRFGRDLTVPQVRAVLFLRREPESGLSRLADHLGISRPAASVLVNVLVRQGLAMRSPDPVERRRIRLSLTPEGTAIAVEARTAARGWLSGALAELTPGDRSTLASAIGILDRLTGDRR